MDSGQEWAVGWGEVEVVREPVCMNAMAWRYVWTSNHYYKGLLIIKDVLLQIFMRML